MDSDDGSGELIGAVLKARVARGNSAESLTGAWQRVLGLIRPILFRRRRSEQVDSDDGGGELSGAVLKARVARGNSAESLIGA